MNKIVVLAGMLILVVGFQNCSNSMSFDSAGSLIAKSGINDTTGDIETPEGVGNNDGAVIGVPPAGGTTPVPGASPAPGGVPPVAGPTNPANPGTSPIPGASPIPGTVPGAGPATPVAGPGNPMNPPAGGGSCKKNPVAANPNVPAGPPADCACILEGPGLSVKAALYSNAFRGQNPVAQSACMTESACLKTVSKILPVKMAVRRGYCKQNPNVVSLTDQQVEASVNAALLSKMMSR